MSIIATLMARYNPRIPDAAFLLTVGRTLSVEIQRFLRWKVPFAVFRSGFGVSEIFTP